MSKEKKNILRSLVPPLLFVLLLWVIKLGEMFTHTDLTFLGVLPRNLSGLPGIVTSPLIHGDLQHLLANSFPLIVLGGSLFYFYKEIALKTLLLTYILPGVCVWLGAREAWHIGASGVVYGLAAFLFFSGIFRKDNRLLAITLMVTFLYGSLVWGIFPDFYPEKNISYEGHFWGLVSGTLLAFYFRKEGPQRKKYTWEIEEEIEEALEEDAEDHLSGNQREQIIRYIYKKNKSDS